jgi:hypothetical protein
MDQKDARAIAEKLTGKSRPRDDEISEKTLRLYKKDSNSFKTLVLTEVEKLHDEGKVTGVETWKRGLDQEERTTFDRTKRAKYNEMLKELYEEEIKEKISPEGLACITLQDKYKGQLNWDDDNELENVRTYLQRVIESGANVPESVINWAFAGRRVQPSRAVKKRKK